MMRGPAMLLEARSLCFTHSGEFQPEEAPCSSTLHDVSFRLEEGSIVLLTGCNGTGKTTLLRLLAGLYEPDSGQLIWQEGSRPPLALVPQNPDVYIVGSLVREDIFLTVSDQDEPARSLALNLAREFGLEHLLEYPVNALSYGQKKKLCLCSALAGRPSLLLLDEPFAGLDHPSCLAMRHILQRQRERGVTQLIVTHDLDMAADLAEFCIVLNHGSIAVQGTATEVFPALEQYGVRPPCWWFTGGNSPIWERRP